MNSGPMCVVPHTAPQLVRRILIQKSWPGCSASRGRQVRTRAVATRKDHPKTNNTATTLLDIYIALNSSSSYKLHSTVDRYIEKAPYGLFQP